MIDNCLEHTITERRQFSWFPVGHTGFLHIIYCPFQLYVLILNSNSKISVDNYISLIG